MIKTTFLTTDQIWGDNALDIIKKYGTKVGATDLTVALGGYMGSDETSDGLRTTCVWSSSGNSDGYVRAVSLYGDEYWYNRTYGYWPRAPLCQNLQSIKSART